MRRRSAWSNTTPTSAPPMSPPTWPPTEMWLITKDSTRLKMIRAPMSVLNGLMPRERSSTAAAPINPNTAPDAPTVGLLGSTTSAPQAPASSAVK
jgi:hypothetical protein